jgi:pimeloyl-ACP methyl ester carboxylesterase
MTPATAASTITIAGRRLSFLAAGSDGPPVLLLHGLGADRLSWMLTQRDIAGFARTVAVDLPGHGQSDRDVEAGDVAFFTDLIAGFLEAQGGHPAHVVGHSLGGAVALDLAHRRPDLVASLFLLAPAGLGRGTDPAFLFALTEMKNLDEASAVLGRLVTRQRLISPQMVARALAEITAPGARDAFRKVAGHLLRAEETLAPAVAEIGRRQLPRAVVWGGDDRINPMASDRVATLGATPHVVEGAGHLPHIESYEEVNALLRSFLAGATEKRR